MRMACADELRVVATPLLGELCAAGVLVTLAGFCDCRPAAGTTLSDSRFDHGCFQHFLPARLAPFVTMAVV